MPLISSTAARVQFVAVSTPTESDLAWARHNLEAFGVILYPGHDGMLNHGGLQAVVLAPLTSGHADEAIEAIEKEKHMLCEKPLSAIVGIVT